MTKPTEMKILQGTAQKCRINQDEPKAPPGVPATISQTDEKYIQAREHCIELLTTMGVLTVWDGLALDELVSTHLQLEELRQFREDNGQFFQTLAKDGTMKWEAYPQIHMEMRVRAHYLVMLQKFGLNPVDRRNVSKVYVPNGTDKLKKLMNG